MEGEERGWHKNGKLAYRYKILLRRVIEQCRRYRKNGRLDGEEKRWFENGQLSYQFSWKDQQLFGKDQGWYPNGKVRLALF